MASQPKKLRSDTKIYILERIEHQIVGSKLPSNRQVLGVFLFNMREFNLSLKDSARLVIEEASIFWEKARIPISEKWYCIRKLETLYNTYKDLQRSHTRQSELQTKRENEFIDTLDDLFDIAARNALTSMKNEIDREFLIAQRKKGREGSLIGVDQKESEKEEKRGERKRKEVENVSKRKTVAEQEKQRYELGKLCNILCNFCKFSHTVTFQFIMTL